jgi:hypothetical protein
MFLCLCHRFELLPQSMPRARKNGAASPRSQRIPRWSTPEIFATMCSLAKDFRRSRSAGLEELGDFFCSLRTEIFSKHPVETFLIHRLKSKYLQDHYNVLVAAINSHLDDDRAKTIYLEEIADGSREGSSVCLPPSHPPILGSFYNAQNHESPLVELLVPSYFEASIDGEIRLICDADLLAAKNTLERCLLGEVAPCSIYLQKTS